MKKKKRVHTAPPEVWAEINATFDDYFKQYEAALTKAIEEEKIRCKSRKRLRQKR